MRIHIARDGQALGVLSLEDLNRELAAGRILATDLAWYEGASGWMPVGQVPGVVAPQRTVWTPPAAQLSEKPETATAVDALGYAGFWKRFAALLLDNFIVGVLVMMVAFVIGAFLGVTRQTDHAQALGGLVWISWIVIPWLYFAVQHSSEHQATLGKRVLGIAVTDLDGHRISFLHATGRYFATLLNNFTLGIGWILAGLTARKQGLHDLVARTLVVNTRESAMPVWAIVLIALVVAIVPVGILAAIAIPAYSDYTNRAKVSEAILAAAPAKLAVSEYYLEHQALPESLEAAGVTSASSTQVSGIELEEGVIVVTLKNGKTIGLEPYASGNDKLMWRCGKAAAPSGATDIAPGDSADLTTARDSELPKSCRG